MSGFTPEWLALREGADHRARSVVLAAKLARALADTAMPEIVDLGCGTGSNLRATAPLLGARQSWTLVDYDPRLIAAAREQLTAWADRARPDGDVLHLAKGGRDIRVAFRQADIDRDLDRALAGNAQLVTASALFDLCSAAFIARFAAAVARRRALFYTVLTYDGRQSWTPAHAADAALLDAFHVHQRTDKGFGASAGPDAPAALAAAFRAEGYEVVEGDSPWVLDGDDSISDATLVGALDGGFADAVGETGAIDAATLGAWREIRHTGAVVGHTDTFARPRG